MATEIEHMNHFVQKSTPNFIQISRYILTNNYLQRQYFVLINIIWDNNKSPILTEYKNKYNKGKIK
jgi:hypothetical protein